MAKQYNKDDVVTLNYGAKNLMRIVNVLDNDMYEVTGFNGGKPYSYHRNQIRRIKPEPPPSKHPYGLMSDWYVPRTTYSKPS